MSARSIATAVAVAASLLALPAAATGNDCTVSFKPETSGFMLNPLLDKLTVASARPKTAKDTCVLQPGDEILHVNQQQVAGARALAVQRYWKSLKPEAAVTFRILRGGTPLTLVSK